MKPTFLCVFLFFFSFSIFSQEFAVGIKGGLNNNTIGDINSIGASFETGHPDELFSPEQKMSYQFGAFLDVRFGKFFFRPEINYVDLKNSYVFPEGVSEWSTTKIDIPILIGYTIFNPVSVYVAPGFNFYNNVTMESANNTQGPSDINYYKSATNFNFGVNIEFKRFGVDLRYEMGNKETEVERQDFIFSRDGALGINQADIYSYKPSMVSLNVNIFLFRTNSDSMKGLFAGLFKGKKCHCPYN